jgi:hypothetical protein
MIHTAFGFSLSLSFGIRLDTTQELKTAFGVFNVLNADVDSLLNVSVSDLLVDDHTDRGLGDIVDDTSFTIIIRARLVLSGFGIAAYRICNLPLVVFVGHTLLDGSVGLDINNISDLVVNKICGELDGALGSKVTGEKVTGASTKTFERKGVRRKRNEAILFPPIVMILKNALQCK